MQSNILKSAMSHGLILGVLFSVNFLLGITGNAWLKLLSNFVMVAILVAVYKMSVRFRDNDCKGVITYGKAFSLIVLMFFFAAIISSLVKYIYFQFINPDYLENLLQQSLLMYEAFLSKLPLSMSTEEIYENMGTIITPISFSLQYIWANVFAGVFVGLIMAGFVKKDKGLFDDKKEVQG